MFHPSVCFTQKACVHNTCTCTCILTMVHVCPISLQLESSRCPASSTQPCQVHPEWKGQQISTEYYVLVLTHMYAHTRTCADASTDVFLHLAMAIAKNVKCCRISYVITLVQTLQRLQTTTNSVIHVVVQCFTLFTFAHTHTHMPVDTGI